METRRETQTKRWTEADKETKDRRLDAQPGKQTKRAAGTTALGTHANTFLLNGAEDATDPSYDKQRAVQARPWGGGGRLLLPRLTSGTARTVKTFGFHCP